MNISSNNNVSFQARLDISKVTTNKERWKEIATIVPQFTKKSPDGVIKVVESAEGISIAAIDNIKKNSNSMIEALFFCKTMDDTFAIYDNNVIAKTLANFFKIGQNARKELAKAEKFSTSMAEKNDNANYKNFNDTFAYFYTEARSIIEDDVVRKAERDEIMRNWEVIV